MYPRASPRAVPTSPGLFANVSCHIASDDARFVQTRHVFPAIAKQFRENDLGLLAEFRRPPPRVTRRLAENYRNADDLGFADGWMVVVDDVIVSEHLLVGRQVAYR